MRSPVSTILKIVLSLFIIARLNPAEVQAQEDVLKITSVKAPQSAQAGSVIEVSVGLEVDGEWHINSNRPNDDFLIPTVLDIAGKKKGDVVLESVTYPGSKDIRFEFSEKPVSVYEGNIVIKARLRLSRSLSSGSQTFHVNVNYQACNNNTCQAPSSVSQDLLLDIKPGGIATADTLSASSDRLTGAQAPDGQAPDGQAPDGQAADTRTAAKSGQTPSVNQPKSESDSGGLAGELESAGLLFSILIVFLGGLALNLTPCVYPLIPITVGYFGGQSEGRTSRLFLLGLLYVLGMALTYSVIGVVTALSGAVFGALLQNVLVVIAISLVLFALSLSMFGLYEFKLPDSLVMKAGGARGGSFGAFFMGLTMGVVAAPCIGPFVLGLVTYVGAKADPMLGFLLFFSLAVGLGLPYLVLALFSGKIKSLPRAGFWMEAVKHIFGFILLGMALYFLLPLIPKSISGYIMPGYMTIAALYLLVFDKKGNEIRGFRLFKSAFSVLIIAVSVYMLVPSKTESYGWQVFSHEKLRASKVENKPVIIDFYADWCIPCKELDAVTFSDSKVKSELSRFTALKVDMTSALTEEKKQLRDKFNVKGMPTVVLLDSQGREIERLTGFTGPAEFLNIIRNIR